MAAGALEPGVFGAASKVRLSEVPAGEPLSGSELGPSEVSFELRVSELRSSERRLSELRPSESPPPEPSPAPLFPSEAGSPEFFSAPPCRKGAESSLPFSDARALASRARATPARATAAAERKEVPEPTPIRSGPSKRLSSKVHSGRSSPQVVGSSKGAGDFWSSSELCSGSGSAALSDSGSAAWDFEGGVSELRAAGAAPSLFESLIEGDEALLTAPKAEAEAGVEA